MRGKAERVLIALGSGIRGLENLKTFRLLTERVSNLLPQLYVRTLGYRGLMRPANTSAVFL